MIHLEQNRDQVCPERKLSKATGLRMLTLSQPLRFLSEDAKELAANGVGQEMRKSMEDADNAFPKSFFLCLGGCLSLGRGTLADFRKDNGYGFPV